VLPLWRDQIRIGVSPDAIVLLRIRRGMRAQLSAKHIEYCQPSPGDKWQAALDALAKLLAQKKWQNANIVVILSNHFVRYLLIPWNAAINGGDEQAAYVKHRFSKVFGKVASNWVVQYSDATAGMPKLASGVDKGLLDGIRQVCQLNKLPLRSIQPYLMPAFNEHRHVFKKEPAWFVTVEPEKLTLALCQQQSWQHISSHVINNERLAVELPLLLDRQLLLSGIEQQPVNVFVFAPNHPKLSLPRSNHWAVSYTHLTLPTTPYV